MSRVIWPIFGSGRSWARSSFSASLGEQRYSRASNFSTVRANQVRGGTIGPFTPFHCQFCFVHPSRRSMSPILPNISVRTALRRSILTSVAQGFGYARLPSAATERRLSAARRCRSPHADGAVAEEIEAY